MNKCKNCGAEFEGNFCPECGTPVSQTTAPASPAAPNHGNGKKAFFRAAALLPLVFGALFSVLALVFCMLPYAVMNDALFGSGSESLGSMYETGGDAVNGIIAFGAIGLAVSLLGLLLACVKRLSYHTLFGAKIDSVCAFLLYAVQIGAFACACAVCADVAKSDGGMGLLSVGAGPVLILVFALLCALLSAAMQAARLVLGKKDPALVQEEKDARAALKAQYAKAPADPYGEESVCAHIRTVMRLKKFSFLFAISMFTGPAGPVLWVIGIVSLFKKPNVKKETAAPAEFFRQSRVKMIASAVFNMVSAVLLTFIPIFVPCFAITHNDASIVPWTRSSLQIGGLLSYLPPSIATPIAVVMFLVFGTLAALCIASAVYCKKAPDRIAPSEEPVSAMQEKISKAKSSTGVRVVKRALPCMVLADLLVAALCITIIVTTNIFSVDKLTQIDLGAPQSRVESVLGTAEDKTPGEWRYYSDNVYALNKREADLEAQFEQALLSGDEARLEKLAEESEKLAEERKNMKYVTIRVLFSALSEVTRIEMFDDETGIPEPSETSSGPRVSKSVTLSVTSISLAEAADFLAGKLNVTYAAVFSDNDVAIDSFGGAEVYSDEYCRDKTEIGQAGTYYLQWSDIFGTCRAVLEVT